MKYTAAFLGLSAAGLAGIVLVKPPIAPASPAALATMEPTSPATAPTPEYYPLNSRTIKLPIKYEKDRKAIRQVKLYVARNGENTWYQEAAVPPDRDSFTFVAKEDGIYWFTMVEEDMQGRNIPADLTRTPPDLKVLVDTISPRVQFVSANRTGEEVVVEWQVDDKNPDDSNTKVHFRAAGTEAYWQEVTLPAGTKSGVRFSAGTTNAVAVRVTVHDLAGNKSEGTRDVAAAGTTTTSLSPPTGPALPAGGTGAAIPAPESLAPIAPGVGPMTPTTPTTPVNPKPPAAIPMSPVGPTNPQPIPTTDPKTAVVPVTPSGPAPVAVWSGGPTGAVPVSPAPTGTSPTVEVSRAQTINYLSFDVGYDVESRGPSGISRIDLWVTRDDGRTWQKWSQHDAKGTSVKVNLGVPANPQPEGAYGFRVVPVSGAGLSEREPGPGDSPDLRVVVDVTPPQLDLFPPVGDPTSVDTLVIQWKAFDKNFGDDPITIEWSEKPAGPWQAVAANEGVQLATAGTPIVRRLANTGSFAWRVPTGLPPRVYLKLTAKDAAGNEKTVVTRDPILVDLVKPRAKINGIVSPTAGTRP